MTSPPLLSSSRIGRSPVRQYNIVNTYAFRRSCLNSFIACPLLPLAPYTISYLFTTTLLLLYFTLLPSTYSLVTRTATLAIISNPLINLSCFQPFFSLLFLNHNPTSYFRTLPLTLQSHARRDRLVLGIAYFHFHSTTFFLTTYSRPKKKATTTFGL